MIPKTEYRTNQVRQRSLESDVGRLVKRLQDGWLIVSSFERSGDTTYILRWPWWRLRTPPNPSKGYAVKTN